MGLILGSLIEKKKCETLMILREGDDISENQYPLVYDQGRGLIALIRTLRIHSLPFKKI